MPKRWGSSHRDGRIYLNPELVNAPAICIDYVIAHEICHLKHPQHDRAFFKLLDQIVPNWQPIKARLEQLQYTRQKGHVLTLKIRRNLRGVCKSWPQGGASRGGQAELVKKGRSVRVMSVAAGHPLAGASP